jgi:cysteinyl-tRNA synthetase
MGKTLVELLADAEAKDDLELALADGTKYKLSDIRGFRGAVDTEAKALKTKREEAERIAKEAEGILGALQAAQKEIEKNTPKPPETKGSDWRKNPLYEELVPVIEAVEQSAKIARENADALKKSLDTSQAVYALERMRRQWAEAKVKPKDKKFEEVVQEVLAAKELDAMGLPTIENYLYRSSEPDRMKVAVDEAIANARKEWEKTQRAANIPKPGATHIRAATKDAPIKNLTELTSELVSQDQEIVDLNEGGIPN